ncbi:hypothetical protein P691DRAFT_697331 [Macrolepiota fuliginosa MF-IS2]|uniref:Uncharacterized protein n=1 Tax=Macrolepiota fuliginosa MF-IS2 TaxID=1400762 RepID=A0A9P5XNJ3_9AGAR|nr:hypothetical protein P691DRAFT_697331 [Macrolepiota fuliginosa MF-IS2]
MSVTFAHPPHPSELVQQHASASYPAASTSKERNPHDVPIFDSKSLIEPTAPILYLPPLLSSLPEKINVAPEEAAPNPEYPPLVTETRLPDIDPASLSLHKALHRFRPLTPDYAATPYAEAFNWDELILPQDEEREWYCVVFRSKRKAGSDGGSLYEADKLAHEEAVRNGGLIMYWYGIPHPETGMNMATCIWQSRKHAVAANSRPHHIRAMRLAASSYEVYDLERYRLSKQKGQIGVVVEQYTGGEVGW